MRYYAAENSCGSATSWGFANTWYVVVFTSKEARDTWVADRGTLTARAIRRDEVGQYSTNLSLTQNRTNAPRPFSGEFWGIVVDCSGEEQDGILGYVECCTDDEFLLVERLNK